MALTGSPARGGSRLFAGCRCRTTRTAAACTASLTRGRSRRRRLFCSRCTRGRCIPVGIPAAAFQLKGGHRHQLADGPAAIGAGLQRIIGDFLLNFDYLLTTFTFILINRHTAAPYVEPCRLCSRRLHSFVYFPDATIIPESASVNITFPYSGSVWTCTAGYRAEPSCSPL